MDEEDIVASLQWNINIKELEIMSFEETLVGSEIVMLVKIV